MFGARMPDGALDLQLIGPLLAPPADASEAKVLAHHPRIGVRAAEYVAETGLAVSVAR